MEPASAKDWELIQCDSEFLQQGGFLRQISVVYSKQHLRLRLMANDWVELLVQKIESVEAVSEIQYGLLREDTEVIIAPRKRETKDGVDWSPPQKLIPSQDDWDEAMLNLHKIMKVEPPLSVVPGCVLVNDAIWNSKEYSWALLEASTKSQEQNKRLVRVICHKSVSQGNAGKLVMVCKMGQDSNFEDELK